MTRDEIVAAVAARLGQRQDLNASILLELNSLQSVELERNGRLLPWFLQRVSSGLVTAANTQTVATPTGFLGDDDEGGLFVLDSEADKYVPLDKVDIGTILASTADAALPERYAIRGTSYYFDPVPDAEYALRLAYYAADTLPGSLSAGSETNLWMTYASDLVLAELTLLMARGYTRDVDLVAMLSAPDGPVNKAWQRLNVETEARKHTDRSYQMGRP